MPKMKSKRAAVKRFRVLGSGKFKRKSSYRSHMMSHKTVKQKRHLRGNSIVHETNEGSLLRMLPYSQK
ncbi:MAG: 50S ribosomal protein L35 [Deltaproteobacteria bacterium]|nr:50S ribosomal protein L35 [Deltaproteobacteria bacterium]